MFDERLENERNGVENWAEYSSRRRFGHGIEIADEKLNDRATVPQSVDK